MVKHYFELICEQIRNRWDEKALTDYVDAPAHATGDEQDYTFGTMAIQVLRLHKLFEQLGLKAGDKIALAGRNCANWAVAYLAVASYRGVIVSILQDFAPEDICNLLKHSDSKALFVGPFIWKEMKHMEALPELEAVISLTNFGVLRMKEQTLPMLNIAERRTTAKEDILKHLDSLVADLKEHNEDMTLINYTSGSTGSPKGVMLPYKAMSNNVAIAHQVLPCKGGQTVVSMLPLAHMYGQLAEFLYPVSGGNHVFFLTRTPTPTLLLKAFKAVQPYLIVTVPLVIEKIYRKQIFPILNTKAMQIGWHTPGLDLILKAVVKKNLKKAFGGNIIYFLCGGAAINPDVEKCLMDIHFPISVGYGMTECGPLIGGTIPKKFVARSGGQVVLNMQAKIDNPNAEGIGEILVKGDNVMLGYYKNEEATKAVFTEDGWMRTGDLGYIDKHNFIFLKGRNKTMMLGPSGQNIYPEEIEDKLNNLDAVVESVVVERDGKLVALVFPDYDWKAEDKSMTDIMKENLAELNKRLPSFSQITNIELMRKEFEKTPKKSIKRFLYK